MVFLEFLAVGTIWFWAVLLLCGIAVSELVDRDRGGAATLVALLTLGALAILGDFNPLAWAMENPTLAALFVPGYLLAGAAWGWLKFAWFARARRRKADAILASFLHQRGIADGAKLTSDDERDLRYELDRQGLVGSVRPLVKEHRGKIIAWMSYWPASILWTLINDPVRRAFVEIYERMGNALQAASDRAFRGADDRLPGN